MSPGAQVRDFIDVHAVGRQFKEHLEFDGEEDGVPTVHHVATGKAQTLLEFSQFWWNHWGAKGKLLPGARPYRPNELMRLASAPRKSYGA